MTTSSKSFLLSRTMLAARTDCLWLVIVALWAAVAAGAESGRLLRVGPIAEVPSVQR